MNADVLCPVCDGAGEIEECHTRCDGSHVNHPQWKCRACASKGDVPETSVDREGELITFVGCNCDEDSPCNDAKCQMERDLEMRWMAQQYPRGLLNPPRDLQRQMYADIMFDAGRDYLLRDDERVF